MQYVLAKSLNLDSEKILQSSYVTENDKAIVAIITEPIFTKSERDTLKKLTASKAKKQLGVEEVEVTFSARAYAMMELGKTYDEVLEVLN